MLLPPETELRGKHQHDQVNFLGMRYTGGINWEAEAGELQVQS